MLFNKKLLMGLSNILGVMLILNFLFYIAMYIWAFFGTPPVQLFDVTQGFISYYGFLYKLLPMVFFYLMIGAFAGIVKGSKLPEKFKK